jgi:hypothetical protein
MTLFDRPLGDRTWRPLLAGLLWGYVTAAAVAAVVALVFGGAWLVRLVGSWFGDGPVSAPWDLARDTAAVLAPFTIASSTWAVTYGSSERNTIIRALAGTAVGVALLVAAVRADAPVLLIAAFGAAWSVAIPFERIGRPAARLLATVAVVTASLPFWPGGTGGWWPGLLAPVGAAAVVGLTDAAWRRLIRRGGDQ